MTTKLDQILSESVQNQGSTQHWPAEVRALVSALRVPHQAWNERRRRDRRTYEVQAKVRFRNGNDHPSEAGVYTRDISKHLIAVLTDVHLRPGQCVSLELPAPGEARLTGQPARQVVGRVRRCRQFREGWFDVLIQEDPSAGAAKPKPALSTWSRFSRLLSLGRPAA